MKQKEMPDAGREHGEEHRHGADRDRHGNPLDLRAYLAKLEDPERRHWQKPDELVAALGLGPGQVVAEIGPGPGVFTRLLARAVSGPGTSPADSASGHVFACEVEPRLLQLLGQRLAEAGIVHVSPILARADDPLLPAQACDLILLVNSYHHLDDGPAYLRRLRRALRPGGRIAIVDFHDGERPVGPPADHVLGREEVLRQAASAGLCLLQEHRFLPYQYFLLLGASNE